MVSNKHPAVVYEILTHAFLTWAYRDISLKSLINICKSYLFGRTAAGDNIPDMDLGPGRLCRHKLKHNRYPKASGIMLALQERFLKI